MSAPWEKYAAAPAAVESGPWAKYQAAPEVEAPAEPSAQTLAVRKAEEERGKGSLTKNLAAGLVRGAGSIGATLLYPIDKATDLIKGDRGPTLSGLVTGQQPLSRNEERRRDMTEGLRSLGADPDSTAFSVGKLGGEIAGTAGTGGVLANALSRVPQVAASAPSLLNAVRTGGFSAGKAGGSTLANLGTRVAGGAITGGASAGFVNPEDAGTGALVGGALPVVTKAAGVAGNAIGKVFRGPEQAPELAKAVQAARTAGYVVPPTQARPTLLNRLAEGFSGKITTAQNASAKNQGVTNSLAAKELGLPADTQLTPDVLKTVRDAAGQAYDVVSSSGTITPGQPYLDALDKIAAPAIKAAQGFPNAKPSPVIELVESLRSPNFDAGSAVAKLKELRTAADDAFRTGNTDVARASKAAAGALEDALEAHLGQIGNPQALQDFREARKLIAKTYSVERAMNPTSGSVDARKLAGQLNKGKPLSGDLKTIADFANRFPKATQTVEGMGSLPQTSPLDWAASGGISAATGSPLMLASVMARPASRRLALSDLVQNRLVQPPAGAQSPRLKDLIQGGYRAAPIALSDR